MAVIDTTVVYYDSIRFLLDGSAGHDFFTSPMTFRMDFVDATDNTKIIDQITPDPRYGAGGSNDLSTGHIGYGGNYPASIDLGTATVGTSGDLATFNISQKTTQILHDYNNPAPQALWALVYCPDLTLKPNLIVFALALGNSMNLRTNDLHIELASYYFSLDTGPL